MFPVHGLGSAGLSQTQQGGRYQGRRRASSLSAASCSRLMENLRAQLPAWPDSLGQNRLSLGLQGLGDPVTAWLWVCFCWIFPLTDMGVSPLLPEPAESQGRAELLQGC